MHWLIALVCAIPVAAQQLSLTVLLRDPLPAAISAWQEDPTLIRVLISSSSPTPSYPNAVISFELRDAQTQRVVARSKDGHPRQPRIAIPAGPTTLTLTGSEIINYEATEIEAGIEEQVLVTGLLPEGVYEFCVRLLDRDFRPIVITGRTCAVARVVSPDPPVLLAPEDTTRLSSLTPLFIWTPPRPLVGPVVYRLRIAPLYAGQDRRSALERNTPVYEQLLSTTTLRYPPTAPSFSLYPDAQGFVWQVQALTPDGRPAARNDGKSSIFLFYPPMAGPAAREAPPTTPPTPPAKDASQEDGGSAPRTGRVIGPDTVLITHIRLGGGFIMRLHTPVLCRRGSSCTIGPDTGYIYIPWLGDTLVVPFKSLTITSLGLPSLHGGTLTSSAVKQRLLQSGVAAAQHVLKILEWKFTATMAEVRARLSIDWTGSGLTCRGRDSVELSWQPVKLTGLPPLRIKIPTAWECSGAGMLLGQCFHVRFDSILIDASFDTLPPRNFRGHLTVGGTLQLQCLNPPANAYFYLRLDRGGADFLVTIVHRIRAQVVGTPLRISLDTLVLDIAQTANPTGFPPGGGCTFPDWSSPNWRGLWIPSLQLSVPIGDNDTADFLARNVVAEDVGGQLKLSLNARVKVRDTIRFAGFRIRLDTLTARWCRGTFSEFALRGLLLLPPGLSKPAGWTQLDSLYIRFTCDASWNWTGSLDIYGNIRLDFGTYARLILQNARLVKVGPSSGYLEFVNVRLHAPADGTNSVTFNGLRIWNDGRVELEGTEGWLNVSNWANLSVGGIDIQVQEVGLGYHQPTTGSCSSPQKRWWVGLSGGISINANSGLPGGGNGVRVRRLRIYDNLCMTSEGSGIDVSISGSFSIRGELRWGDITYGSGSGSVQAKGLQGTLSGSFTCLGGVEAQVDFALGSVSSPSPYKFWFVQGAVVVPGGVPIVPGAFHLVGGLLGAGWHVKLDNVNRNQISETNGIVPPPPLVPDPHTGLMLRGGLIFADGSLQFYRLTVTGTIAFGSSTQLAIDGGVVIIPALRVVEGSANATMAINGGRLQPPISLSGGASVRLSRIQLFSAGFSTQIQPGSSCFHVGPSPDRNWILADLDANIGTDILGAEVVAKAYASLWGLYVRLCPTEGEFQGNFRGAGVVGVKLEVARASVPFHFGVEFSTGFCGYYYFRFQRSGNNYTGRAKLGGGLGLSLTFDQSGWPSWKGWRGTQAADHLQGYYCGSGNWVDLSKHWSHCRKNDDCNKDVQDCRQVSIELRARGVFDGQISIPRTCFTVAGRQVCLPKLHQLTISADYGYYGYGRWNNREGAKKGGPLANQAEALSCSGLANERQQWANNNVSEQQPPALVITSSPGRGQTGVSITQRLWVKLGAPANGSWSSGGSGLRQWQIRNLAVSLWDLGFGTPRQVSIQQHLHVDSLSLVPLLQIGGSSFATVLLPNTPYRLIIEGDFWARNPNGTEAYITRSRDTLPFTTGAPSEMQFEVSSSIGPIRDTSAQRTPAFIALYNALRGLEFISPLQFGRDIWLRIRDGVGRTYEWRGPPTPPIRAVRPASSGAALGVQLELDTLEFQPIATNMVISPIRPNTFHFTLLNAKKAGSTAPRPDTANRLLEGLPLELDRWTWTRQPSAAELQLRLSTRLRWSSLAPGDDAWYAPAAVGGTNIPYTDTVVLENTGAQKLFAGTPFRIIVRKNVRGTVTEIRSVWHLPQTLLPGGSVTIPVTIPIEPDLQGWSIRILPRLPFTESNHTDNCVDTGPQAGCAQCQPPSDCLHIPSPITEAE
ncbi:MAG: hypothetical protein NZ960_01350 [Candidatus Kapabacteria bacterium]|nr:hypothetical protein [Candidatus Kapabacteria bacterium]MDW8011673.1 hypothetical protein [Bacteroidota bacterium]